MNLYVINSCELIYLKYLLNYCIYNFKLKDFVKCKIIENFIFFKIFLMYR